MSFFTLLDPVLVVELLTLGLCTGFLAGLLGIGGGMLMVPFITFILTSKGFPAEQIVKMAVATSLATICFTSISSVWAHHKRGAVLWPVAIALAPGILLGSLIGAQLAVALPGVDPVTTTLEMIPLIILFELSIWLSVLILKLDSGNGCDIQPPSR